MSDFENIDDELLSAYLDDELSPEERGRVEARLASDPAARQTLDQLRAASQALRSLPREAVGHDLRDAILRRAEAEMLASNGGPIAAAATKSAATDGSVSLRDSLPRITVGQTRRGWIWAGLALAAGLLIMVVQPGERQANNLPSLASKSEERIDRLAVIDGAGAPAKGEPRLAKGAESASAVAPSSAPSVTAPLTETIALDAAAAPQAAPAADSDARASESFGGGALVSGQGALSRAPASARRYGVEPNQSERGGGKSSDSLAMGGLSDDLEETSIAYNSAVPGSATAAVDTSEPLSTESPPVVAGSELSLVIPASGQPATTDELAKVPAQVLEQEFVVVHVVATPEALRNKSFDRVLTNNGILWEEPVQKQRNSSSTREGLAQTEDGARPLGESDRGREEDESGVQATEDVIVVAAPKAAIESCLADLNQDQQNYLSVSVDNALAPTRIAGEKDKSLLEAKSSFKKLAVDLGTRYNRGTAPSQDVELSRRFAFFDYFAVGGEETADNWGLRGGYGGGVARQRVQEPTGSVANSPEQSLQGKLAKGRARRIESKSDSGKRSSELQDSAGVVADDFSPPAGPAQFGSVPQQGRAAAELAGDKLYVLFFLSPGNTPPAAIPPSPPAENRQE